MNITQKQHIHLKLWLHLPQPWLSVQLILQIYSHFYKSQLLYRSESNHSCMLLFPVKKKTRKNTIRQRDNNANGFIHKFICVAQNKKSTFEIVFVSKHLECLYFVAGYSGFKNSHEILGTRFIQKTNSRYLFTDTISKVDFLFSAIHIECARKIKTTRKQMYVCIIY